nr:MAG TPA: hypothetical protein [Caudoviricetes sp.]
MRKSWNLKNQQFLADENIIRQNISKVNNKQKKSHTQKINVAFFFWS